MSGDAAGSVTSLSLGLRSREVFTVFFFYPLPAVPPSGFSTRLPSLACRHYYHWPTTWREQVALSTSSLPCDLCPWSRLARRSAACQTDTTSTPCNSLPCMELPLLQTLPPTAPLLCACTRLLIFKAPAAGNSLASSFHSKLRSHPLSWTRKILNLLPPALLCSLSLPCFFTRRAIR